MEIDDMINCPNCKNIIEKKDFFCKYCGQRNRCKECGKNTLKKENSHAASFNYCTSCGHCSDQCY